MYICIYKQHARVNVCILDRQILSREGKKPLTIPDISYALTTYYLQQENILKIKGDSTALKQTTGDLQSNG